MFKFFTDNRRCSVAYWISRFTLLLILLITFVPILLTIFMSMKKSVFIEVDFWGLPEKIAWSNYLLSYKMLIRPIFNSLIISCSSIIGILTLAALSGYSFGRFEFRGKEVLFIMLIGIMMIPGALMVVPQFTVISRLGLIGSYFALILPYIAGLQLFGILLTRSFFGTLPEEMFEAAEMEGAGEFYKLIKIALPLCWPVLITIGLTSFIAMYNDYIWPTLVLNNSESQRTFCQAIVAVSTSEGAINYGVITAGYIVGSLPMLFIVGFLSKYFVEGMLQGAVKA